MIPGQTLSVLSILIIPLFTIQILLFLKHNVHDMLVPIDYYYLTYRITKIAKTFSDRLEKQQKNNITNYFITSLFFMTSRLSSVKFVVLKMKDLKDHFVFINLIFIPNIP